MQTVSVPRVQDEHFAGCKAQQSQGQSIYRRILRLAGIHTGTKKIDFHFLNLLNDNPGVFVITDPKNLNLLIFYLTDGFSRGLHQFIRLLWLLEINRGCRNGRLAEQKAKNRQ